MLDKKTLRREVRARVAQIAVADALERSETIGREVEGHLAVSGAKVVALFSPLADEPQIWPLVERLARRMSVVLPRVEGDVMNFYGYGDSAMAKGAEEVEKVQKQVESYEQIKELISVDTLKTMQLLGFNYKAAIGEPLTQICANAISNLGNKNKSSVNKQKK